MDFSLNENQIMYVDTVRKLVKNEITPHILEMEKAHIFPWGIIVKAWEMGVINLCIPESIKGFAIDVISSALIIEELSYGDTVSPLRRCAMIWPTWLFPGMVRKIKKRDFSGLLPNGRF